MKRNYGIDLLKMLLMFLVVALHILGQGGMLSHVSMRTANYYIVWMIYISGLCLVNCYALITGYFHYDRKYSLQSMLLICLQALFYSILLYGLFWIIMPERFNHSELLDAFFPVIRRTHWYTSSYVGLFLLIPMLNMAIKACSREMAKYYLILSTIAFSVIPTFFLADPFKLLGGYSAFWLIHMYVVGAFIKKYNWETKLSRKRLLLIYALATMISVCSKLVIDEVTTLLIGQSRYSELLFDHNSPTMLVAGIALFLFFLSIEPGNGAAKLLRTFSPAAFGVYLIHCHPYVFAFLKDRFAFLAGWHPILMVLGLIGCSIVMYVFCLLIDLLRIQLFARLHFKELTAKISDKLVPEQIREGT